MKKLLTMYLLSLILFSITACTDSSTVVEESAFIEKNVEFPEAPETIELEEVAQEAVTEPEKEVGEDPAQYMKQPVDWETESMLEEGWDCYIMGDESREEFIDKLMGDGVSQAEPLYAYGNEEDAFELEFYYDELKDRGCGICYFRFSDGSVDRSGFAFCGSETDEWAHDKMSLLAKDGSDGKDKGVKDLEEVSEYNEAGQLVFYELSGVTEEDEEEKNTVIKAKFTYREDGTLSEKYFFGNTWIWGTAFNPYISEYDEKERLTWTSSYLTHGGYEQIYIYNGDEMEPEYCLELDIGMGLTIPRFIKYK